MLELCGKKEAINFLGLYWQRDRSPFKVALTVQRITLITIAHTSL